MLRADRIQGSGQAAETLALAEMIDRLPEPPGAPAGWTEARARAAAGARAAVRTGLRGGVSRPRERPRLHKSDLSLALLGLLDRANKDGAHGVAKGLSRVIAAVQGSRIVGERRHG